MNTDTSRITKSKKRTIAIIALALASLAILLLTFSCTSPLPAEVVEENRGTDAYQISDNSLEVDITEDTGNASTTETADTGDEETPPIDNSLPSTDEAQQASSRDGSANHTSQPSGSGSSAAAAETSNSKRWVDDTEQVWIVDRQARSESVPVYSTTEVSICNICGSDITGNTAAHGKARMKAGEGSGHHSEVRQSITGCNTVNHPEEGHWETKAIGGHWGKE